MNDESWFGEDKNGNKYCLYTDKSPNDFWIETVIVKDNKGNYIVWSCNIVSKTERDDLVINK